MHIHKQGTHTQKKKLFFVILSLKSVTLYATTLYLGSSSSSLDHVLFFFFFFFFFFRFVKHLDGPQQPQHAAVHHCFGCHVLLPLVHPLRWCHTAWFDRQGLPRRDQVAVEGQDRLLTSQLRSVNLFDEQTCSCKQLIG